MVTSSRAPRGPYSRTIFAYSASAHNVPGSVLKGAGYFVAPASNAAEALTIWKVLGPSFGLVIADLSSTEMSNLVLVDQLADRGATVPILIISSSRHGRWLSQESTTSYVS